MAHYASYNDNNDNKGCWWILILLAMIWWALFSMVGCTTTKFVPVKEIEYKYINTTDTVRDSIYHNVFRNVYVKGDTVHDDRVEIQYRDRWRTRTKDSIIYKEKPVPYPVERKLGWWEQIRQDWFDALVTILIALLAIIALLVKRMFYKKKIVSNDI